MKLGVVGLPNVGKSTLFNAITQAGAEAANYPFCTIEPNTGVVPVPDPRLDHLAALYSPKKKTLAIIEFVDIAGLVKGASRGEGLGNKFLAHIREVDAIVHVVRCFEDENIIHVDGSVDPVRDIETIQIELIAADRETVARRQDRAQKMMKGGDKKYAVEADTAGLLLAHLDQLQPARTCPLGQDQAEIVRDWFLLSAKPVIYVANIAESGIEAAAEDLPYVAAVTRLAQTEGAQALAVCAQIEQEIAGLPPDEKRQFLLELGIGQSGLDKLVAACYELLGLISFLTAGADECRAWTITRGTRAPQAAGKIHTDFERGFIRAEVVSYETLAALGSMAACKDKGLVRSEGKDYVMKDGDIVLFRFNV
ncbi:MAG: redox-regulated ATPase YchF [Oscillospiraceae bacterium]|jgi:GTP-binding protein YchF|nr:redox-regulated ATPase YchF [Oscillospiraceae bacterium]